MSNLSKTTKVPAATKYTKLPPIKKIHPTTNDFFTVGIPFFRELAAGQTLTMNRANCHIICNSMPAPTFSNIRSKTKFFWVPIRSIWKFYNNFKTHTIAFDGANPNGIIPNKVPTITVKFLWEWLLKWDNTTEYPLYTRHGSSATSTYDLRLRNTSVSSGDGMYVELTLTKLGRRVVTLLRQLGFQFPYCAVSSASAIRLENLYNYNLEFSILPLLAYFRVMYDRYLNYRYLNTFSDYTSLKYILSNNWINPTFSENMMSESIFLCMAVMYDIDYFTSAFDSPFGGDESYSFTSMYNGYNSEINPFTNLPQISTYGGSSNYDNFASILLNSTYSANAITQNVIDTLKKYSIYIKKNQLIGDRPIDRFYAQFGEKLSDDSLNMSSFIEEDIKQIDINEVFSNADTDYAQIGDYAGRGTSIKTDGCNFKWHAKEFGYLIAINTIIPDVGYYQGYAAHTRHIYPMDFYEPMADGLGMRLIEQGEVYAGNRHLITCNKGFGFKLPYLEYKTDFSTISGDFSFHSMQNELGAYHTMRNLETYWDDTNETYDIIQGRWFMNAGKESSEFDRIFNTTKQDGFKMIYVFDFELEGNFRSPFDDQIFDNEHGQEKTTINVAPNQMN